MGVSHRRASHRHSSQGNILHGHASYGSRSAKTPTGARGHPKSHPNSLARDTPHFLRVVDRNTSRCKRYHVVAAVELRGRCGLALCGAGTATRDFSLQLAYAESHLEMYVCTEAWCTSACRQEKFCHFSLSPVAWLRATLNLGPRVG
jgi:hypothetical protein